MFNTPTFNLKYAALLDKVTPPSYFITQTQSLADVIENGSMTPDTHILLSTIGDTTLAIPTLALVYHKVAQGMVDGQPIMMTFCALCNAGTTFCPIVEDKVHTFGCTGYYQGMTLLGDDQTMSRWNHITGDCVHGKLEGKCLDRISDIRHMTAEQALNRYPDAQIANPTFGTDESQTASNWNQAYRITNHPAWSDGLLSTLAMQDERLPRFDMGIGLWTNSTARYYRVLDLNNSNDVILDTVDGRNVVIYMNQESALPGTFYTDATEVTRKGDGLYLDNGQIYYDGLLHQNDKSILPKRPNYQVMRWYSFAYLFPNCEIYSM